MEKICPNCVSSMPETSRFCTECGKPFPVPQPKQAPQNPDPPKQPDAQDPPAAYEPFEPSQPAGDCYPAADPTFDAFRPAESEPGLDSPYQPVGTWGWFGTMILLKLPIIGFLLTIVWACGGCRKVNKRNYCRALLLNLAVTVILVGVIGGVCLSVVSKVLNDPAVQDALPQLLQGLLGDLGFRW